MDGFTACPERAIPPQTARNKSQPIYLESQHQQNHSAPKAGRRPIHPPLPLAKITKPQVTSAQPLV